MTSTKQIHGKRRFSKVERTTYSSETSFEDAFEQHGRPDGEGGQVIGRTFAESIEGMAEASRRLLVSSGLPDAPTLYWLDKSLPDQWQADKPADFKKIQKAARLDAHIIEALGYAHDTPEGVAARIICNADFMAHSERDEALEAAFRLGELRALAKVYGIESAKNARKGPRAKREITEIIRDLARLKNGVGEFCAPSYLWELLASKIEEEYGGRPEEKTTDSGNLQYVYVDENEKPKTITKQRFENRLSEIRKS